MADRTPPINLTLEATLLGQVLVKNTVYDTVSSVVRAEMFADPAHAMVWEALATLIDEGRSATVMTLRAYLDHEKILGDIGGVDYLQDLVDATMTTVNALDLAREIRTLAVLREAMATAEQIAETAAKPNLDMDVDHFLDDIDARLGRLRLAARPASGSSGSMRDYADQARDEALAAYRGGAPVRGLRTGMGAIDAKLPLGFRPGHFVVLAARPGMGKSSLATDLAVSIAEQVWPEGRRPVVGLWSLEMSGSEIASRMYAPRMGISATDIMGGKMTQPQAERLLVVAEEIAQLGIHVFDDFSLSPTRLRAQARILKRERGLDLVIVDYLQLMEPPEHRRRYTSRVDEVTEISRGLKSVARELEVPVLALSQLTRDVDNREDNRPRLSDLRESGSIEQDADVVMMLYRQEYYLHGRKPQTDTLNETRKIEVENAWYAALARCQGKAELSIAKARGGATGRIELDWSGTLTTFRDTHRPPDPQDTLAL